MVRWLVVVAVVAALAALPALGDLRSVHHTQPLPSFIEIGEHGFDPFCSSYCRESGHTSFATENVNLIAGDGLVQVGSNRGCYAPQNEPTLAQDPTDPLHLVAGANDYRLCCDGEGRNDGTGWAYVSRDGGKSWRDVLLPGLTSETAGRGAFSAVDSAGDPSIAFAPNGKDVYYANIVFNRLNTDLSGIAVSTSHDGGSTWAPPRMVLATHSAKYFHDKEWVTVGADGRVAVTWTLFAATDWGGYVAPIVGSISSDQGVHWSKPFLVSDYQHPINQGSQPFFDAKGRLVVVHEGIGGGEGRDEILVSTVGRSGPKTREVASVHDEQGCFETNQDDRHSLTGEQFRASTMPSAAMDPKTGTIAIAFADGELGCQKDATNAQIKLLFVNGSHRSPSKIVTSGRDKAFPAVAFRDDKVTLGFYTRDYSTDPKHIGLDYAYASSTDGFQEHRLSDGSSNPYMQFRGSFLGDYTALVVGPDGFGHAVWTDSRGGDQNILTASW